MEARQSPPRILYVATWIVVNGVLGSLFWLMTAPPANYINYQLLFRAAFNLVFGSIFMACSLFYNSWFATIMGAHNVSVIMHFGPNRARIGFAIAGVIFLVLGIAGVLLHL